MINDFGNSQVTIEKEKLLTTIRQNRDLHEAEYHGARVGYREALKHWLARALATHGDGKEVNRKSLMDIVEPRSRLKDYERVILMLEMSVATEITISEEQFRQYVLDEWQWSIEFKSTVGAYHGR